MLEEPRPEIGQLAFADAAHGEKRRGRPGPHAGQIAQRRVAEDDVRGHAALVGDLPAQRAQALEQAAVDAFP